MQARHSLADNLGGQAAIDQGVTVLLILLAGIAVSLLLFAALRWEERREGRLSGRAVAISRNPKVLKRDRDRRGSLVGRRGGRAIGGRAWHQFSSPDIQFPSNPQAHFADLSGAGRHEFWEVAIEAFGEKPILGHGAGTYQFSWNQLRTIECPVHDAHSLYLQAFAELGIVGGLLVLGLVAHAALDRLHHLARRARPQREPLRGPAGGMLAFAVGAAFDWFWQIAASARSSSSPAASLVAARCGQLAADPPAPGEPEGRRSAASASTVAGLAVAWSRRCRPGRAAAGRPRDRRPARPRPAREDFDSAVDHAETARSIEPWAATPYLQLGLLAERQGEYPAAITHFSQAIDREDRNWQLYYLRSRVEHEAGEARPPRRTSKKRSELNPVRNCLRRGMKPADERQDADTEKIAAEAARRRAAERRDPAPRPDGGPARAERARAARGGAARCCGACSPPATGWR